MTDNVENEKWRSDHKRRKSSGLESENVESTALHIPQVLELIREFYCLNSFMYIGCLTKQISREWGGIKQTALHLVSMSRRRISRLFWNPPRRMTRPVMMTWFLRCAALKGYLPGVKRIMRYCDRTETRLSSERLVPVMDSAARSGSIEVLDYLDSYYYVVGTSTVVQAIHSPNSVEVVKWLLDGDKYKFDEFDDVVEVEAAKAGNIEVLKIFSARKRFPGFAEKVMKYAAASGSLELVRFLDEKDCTIGASSLCMASMMGHLHVVMYLRERGCPWDTRACWLAAYFGHIGVLKWLREENPPCPWDFRTAKVAKERGHDDLLTYALDNNCPVEIPRRGRR